MTRKSIFTDTIPEHPSPVRSKLSTPVRESGDPYAEYVQRVERAPEHATTRGMFFLDLLQRTPNLSRPRPRYMPFTSYPIREFMQLLLAAARASYPGLAPGEALRRLGHTAYAAFANSIAGTALFGITRHEYLRIMELAPKGYALSVSPGSLELDMKEEGIAVAQLRDIWAFPEVYHRGLFEGAMKELNVRGTVEVVALSASAVDLHLTWQAR